MANEEITAQEAPKFGEEPREIESVFSGDGMKEPPFGVIGDLEE
jgi:hypothetical protein